MELLPLEAWLWALVLGAARALPIAWQIPAFGGEHVPVQVRLGLGLALAALCLPLIMSGLPAGGGGAFWVLLLAREVAVGLTVGFVAATVFRAAHAATRRFRSRWPPRRQGSRPWPSWSCSPRRS
jgi:flagellar biosynthesis protein FliR